MKVFVAVRVLQVENMAVVVRPEVLADAALLIVGDGPGGVELAALGHPHIEHAIPRRDERDVFAIRRQTRLRLFGIAEQRGARNQRRPGHGFGRCGRRLRGGEGGNCESHGGKTGDELVHGSSGSWKPGVSEAAEYIAVRRRERSMRHSGSLWHACAPPGMPMNHSPLRSHHPHCRAQRGSHTNQHG